MAEQPSVHNDISGWVRGNVVQSRDVTLAMHSSPPVAVAGLPPQPVFVGRVPELARLIDALRPDSDTSTIVVSTVSGLAGVGKTALAIRAAHQLLADGTFPGGVVMINLRGYDPPADRVTATSALASLLGALGVRGEHIPQNEDDRARLWRSILAETPRLLIIADNASTTDQVRPLLPGIPTHRVLVTSRHRLTDLDGARLLDLDVLSLDDAVLMLTEELAISDPDDDRVRSAPSSAERVVSLCGALPLAVRVAAAQLAVEPDQSLADLTAALTDRRQRLQELDYDGSLAVRSAFDLSYAHLNVDSARLFRLVALNPGPEFGVDAAAALLGVNTAEARRLIRTLRRANLFQPGNVRDRWRLHDLLRVYAEELVAHDSEHDAALERLLDCYLSIVADADEYLQDPPIPTDENRFSEMQQALEWIDTERGNVVSAVAVASTAGHHVHAIKLSRYLYEYFGLRIYWSDWISTHSIAITSAQQCKDRASEASLLIDLGEAYCQIGRLEEALECEHRALTICEAAGAHDEAWLIRYARASSRLGQAYRDLGKFSDAVRYNREALQIFQDAGDRVWTGNALFNLAVTYRKMGNLNKALEYHLRDLRLCREMGARLGESRVLNTMAIVYREMARFTDAIDCHQQSLRICREVNDIYGEARTVARLGVTYRESGQLTKALEWQQRALRKFREAGARGDEGNTLHDLGVTYQRLGRSADALQCWEMALELFTTLPGSHAARSVERLRDLVKASQVKLVEEGGLAAAAGAERGEEVGELGGLATGD